MTHLKPGEAELTMQQAHQLVPQHRLNMLAGGQVLTF